MSEELNKLAKYRCESVLKATRENEKFDPEFIENMLEDMGNGKHLSSKQYKAIENIHDSWTK